MKKLFWFLLLILPTLVFTGSTTDEILLKQKAAGDFKKSIIDTEITSPDELGWTGNTKSCKQGKISAEMYKRMLTRINYFRRLAGVNDEVYLDSSWNKYAQAAALIMYSSNTLTHSPTPAMKCYSKTGKEGAETSNLGSIVGASIKMIVADDIQDAGESNKDCGHRRWILYSQAIKMGVGATPGSTAIRVFQKSEEEIKDTSQFRGIVPAYFAYPFQGYIPYQVVYPKWSFSIPSEQYTAVDFRTATVTVTAGAKTLATTIINRGDQRFGDPSLIWNMKVLKEDYEYDYYNMSNKKDGFKAAGLLDQKITVKIKNVRVDGEVKNYEYSFTIFSPEEYY
jgi:Cysteine-rich secretory protein family